MSDININDLTNSAQSAIDNINASIKSNKYGLMTIHEMNKQKSILSKHIEDLSNKESVNEDDLKNTTRLVAIAATKQLTAQPKSKEGGLLLIGALAIVAAAATFYYSKKKN